MCKVHRTGAGRLFEVSPEFLKIFFLSWQHCEEVVGLLAEMEASSNDFQNALLQSRQQLKELQQENMTLSEVGIATGQFFKFQNSSIGSRNLLPKSRVFWPKEMASCSGKRKDSNW